jgi:D-threonine aldolase
MAAQTPGRAGTPVDSLQPMRTSELTTPALLVDAQLVEDNIRTMADALPGARMRPHVKAHKCTALARRQAAAGHSGFTCATMREMEGMARAGLDDDLLLANEVADASRLGVLTRAGARVTVAVDSDATIDVAARAGVPEVLIDVNVGLPRCGCRPEDAGRLADRARAAGLTVRGSWDTRAISSGCRIAPHGPPCSRNQWRSWPPRPNKSEAT